MHTCSKKLGEPFFTPKDLAQTFKLTQRTLQEWRASGRGPAFVRVGRGIRYSVHDIRVWLQRSHSKAGALFWPLLLLASSITTLSAAQQFYISRIIVALSNGDFQGNRLSSSGVISLASPPAPQVETCPTGVVPNWVTIAPDWVTHNPTIPANAICFVEDTNSLGDAVLLAGDAWLVKHAGGGIVNLTADLPDCRCDQH